MSIKRTRPQKTLTMEAFTEFPRLPPDFAKTSWKSLKLWLQELMGMKSIPSGLECHYQTVNALCNNDDTQFILDKLLRFLYKHIQNDLTVLENFRGEQHEFINLYDQHWEIHQKNVGSVLSVFMALDGVIRSRREKGILERVNERYREDLVRKEMLYERLIKAVLLLIYEERALEVDSLLQLKRMVGMLQRLDLYRHRFYQDFIRETDVYYKNLAEKLFETSNISEYLNSTQKALVKEQERRENYLVAEETSESIQKVENRMIKDMAEQILDKGMTILIQSNKLYDLKLLYKLFKQVDMVHVLELGFVKVVKVTGLQLVAATNEERSIISQLLEFREKIETIMQQAFENSMKFKYSNKLAWEEFCNTNTSIPLLCAQDLDENLKKNTKIKLTDQELESRIEGVINIFKLLSSKDVFEAFYFQHLAKRLLLDKSKSNDLEKSVIAKLKAECGAPFISRLHNMQKDIDVSKTYMDNFKQEYSPTLDFFVWTLTGSSWPKASYLKPLLPKEMQKLQEDYTRFYTNIMKKKLLSWSSSMSYCEIQCNLQGGNKSFIVSLHQSLILLLFNKADNLRIDEITEMVGLPIEIVRRETLQICAKSRILLKQFKTKEIKNDEVITFNPDFTHKYYKITINSLQIKENKLETMETIEKVMNERQFVLDAAIVRIMKTRRALSHSALISECFAIVRFSVSAADVKKRIERLIEQEYLRRDDTDKSLYHYIT